jgi:hypothetical protein
MATSSKTAPVVWGQWVNIAFYLARSLILLLFGWCEKDKLCWGKDLIKKVRGICRKSRMKRQLELGMVVHACDSNNQEAEAGGTGIWGQSWLYSETSSQKNAKNRLSVVTHACNSSYLGGGDQEGSKPAPWKVSETNISTNKPGVVCTCNPTFVGNCR